MQATRAAILAAIATGPVPGPELADRLDISRAAVWKHIEALREEGFEIESDDGYTLTSVPEFGGAAVAFDLDAPYDIEYHDSIPSTNARARELAVDGTTDLVVLADEQTGGRGRLDREWSSPSGGIWLSILLRPDVPATHAPMFTLAAAVATADAASAAGVDATIKWPNDVLVGEAKLAGILTEMEGEADRIGWIVVGIGLNANVDPGTLPPEATSLQAAVGAVNRRDVTQTLLESFATLADDIEGILPAWRERAATLGREVRVETPQGTIEGEAVDITFPGTLEIETPSGRKSVAAGDCEHLRPTNS